MISCVVLVGQIRADGSSFKASRQHWRRQMCRTPKMPKTSTTGKTRFTSRTCKVMCFLIRATFTLAALRAAQALNYIGQQRVPSRDPGERLRSRCSRVTAFAPERQHILAKVVAQLENVEWRARRHHPTIVQSVECWCTSSSRGNSILYKPSSPASAGWRQLASTRSSIIHKSKRVLTRALR